MTKIYGFTLLRNGIKYDYSFRECLISLSKLVDTIYIAVGDSDDGTRKALEEFPFLKIIDTKWDPSLMGDGGQILSQQTNVALEALRKDHGNEENTWGMYLQCDELIHENQINQIKKDIQEAQNNNHDSVRFRYLHFWKDHYHFAISKRWYPQEVRCIKLKTDILSYGDAQGFSTIKNPYESDCFIYHYGHVRDAEKLSQKQELLMKMIRPAEKFKKYFNREKRSFANTKYIRLLSYHPKIMKNRIEEMGEDFELPSKKLLYLVGNKDDLKQDFLKRVLVKKLNLVSSIKEVPFEHRENRMIVINPTFLETILYPNSIPKKMESPLSRTWTKEFQLILRLSSKGYSIK